MSVSRLSSLLVLGRRPATTQTVYLLSALFAGLVWLCFVSHGFTANGIIDSVYEIQAASLADGRLSIAPGPTEMHYIDVLMYWGTYYFYWGLLPSAVLAVFAELLGRISAHYIIVLFFFVTLIYFYERMVSEVIDSAMDERSDLGSLRHAVCILTAWVLLFVIPYPDHSVWFFGRFLVYEQQIVFGLALAMPGIYFFMIGLKEKRAGRLAVAVLFLSAAAWTRVTWVPVALFALPVSVLLMWLWRPDRGNSSQFIRGLLWLIPSVALLSGLLYLNYVRFDSPFDFGVRYQNPAHILYMRNLKLFFSPITRIWTFAFNIASYYLPPQLVELLDLKRHAYSYCEGFPPSFFYFNPQFLPMIVLFPLGLLRSWKRRSPLLVPMTVLAFVTLYLNFIFGVYGTMVIVRYFVEFYYFLILLFLAALLTLIRPRYAVPIIVLMLAFHIPSTVEDFLRVRPELRTVRVDNGSNIVRTSRHVDFFTFNPSWPQRELSIRTIPRLSSHAVMGVVGAGREDLLSIDTLAIYFFPGGPDRGESGATLKIQGMKSLHGHVTGLFFIENRPVGSIELGPDKAVDASLRVPFKLPGVGPYQVLCFFLPPGRSYLPPRETGAPVVRFHSILLVKDSLSSVPTSVLPQPIHKN